MEQEEKDRDLLLRDLCARLAYGVKIQVPYDICSGYYTETVWTIDNDEPFYVNGRGIEYIKPYLFPLSSMTDEEWEEYQKIRMIDCVHGDINGTFINSGLIVDWLNAHHFDYRGLIDKSLALDANGLNIY